MPGLPILFLITYVSHCKKVPPKHAHPVSAAQNEVMNSKMTVLITLTSPVVCMLIQNTDDACGVAWQRCGSGGKRASHLYIIQSSLDITDFAITTEMSYFARMEHKGGKIMVMMRNNQW